MSYDINFKAKLKNNYVYFGEFNMTYNIRDILVESSKVEEWSSNCTLKVSEIYDKFANGLNELKNNRKAYTHLEPENGWGNIDTVIRFYEWFFDLLADYDAEEFEQIELNVY